MLDARFNSAELPRLMELKAYRKSRGKTQREAARELDLKSPGTISCIESGRWKASVRLALKIENWSEGHVPARSVVRPEEAHLLPDTPQQALG